MLWRDAIIHGAPFASLSPHSLHHLSTTVDSFPSFCSPLLDFVSPPHPRNPSPAPAMSMKTVLDMPGIQAPIGYFDPVGYSTKVSDEGMLWFRAAELKHSRVAMLAFTGEGPPIPHSPYHSLSAPSAPPATIHDYHHHPPSITHHLTPHP